MSFESNPTERRLSSELGPELPPGTEVDGFVVKRLVGEGAMGRVYLAQDVRLGRAVALKFVKSESEPERFLDEARATARFNHPHIVTLYGAGVWNHCPYLVLEFLSGPSLRQRLRQGRLPLREALRLGRAVAEAIAEAHRHGVLHADLKPENVVIPPDGRPRVVDFGLALMAGFNTFATSGTPAYMAPERWTGGVPTEAIDLWSFGVMLYEMVMGARPFSDGELLSLGRLALRPIAAPEQVRALVEACLAVEPARRPSAQDVALELAALCAPTRPHDEARSPFRGLAAFGEGDAEDYFGRDAEVASCVEVLRGAPLLPVVGASGVGKSSFIVAGILPRLRESEAWTLVRVRPGLRPLASLAAALDDAQLAPLLASEPGAVVGRLATFHRRSGGHVLLFVDQFEELFTLATPEDAAAFFSCLAAAAMDSADPWRVVLALRDDFLASLARVPSLAPSLGATVVLAPVGRAGLEAAITEPLRRAGYQLDPPTLAARIAVELEGAPAALPLLQFACMALWEHRDTSSRRLTAAQYEALGGASGALAAHAEALVSHLSATEVKRLRAVLLSLVNPDGTRHPRSRRELVELDPGSAATVDELVKHRLLVSRREAETDEAIVELAHESLAVGWPRLRSWLDETHERRALMAQLEQAAGLWAKRGERDTETWTGDALAQVLHRLEQWDTQPGGVVGRFLAAGRRRSQKTRLRRQLTVGAVFAMLAASAAAATSVALEFRRREQLALAQQAEIRLAAADTGLFDLILTPWDFDSNEQQAIAAGPQGFDFVLHRPDTKDPSQPGATLAEVHRTPLDGGVDGQQVFRVEAPAGSVLVEVLRPSGGCGASWIHLQRLPGYTERRAGDPTRIELPVPTCRATRASLVTIPGGPWWRTVELSDGGVADEPAELPTFAIDRVEVSNGAFAPFERLRPLTGAPHLTATQPAVLAEARGPRFPVTGIDAKTAEAYCSYLGKQLPTTDEWQKAARGGLTLDDRGQKPNPRPRRRMPWGDGSALVANLAGSADGVSGEAPVGTMLGDVSPYGVFDLGGNVAEWTATPADTALPDGLRFVLGGTWAKLASLGFHYVGWTDQHAPGYSDFALGVRCALH